MFGWIQKKLAKKWIDELEKNVEGMRKMADAYRNEGGFKEVAETLKTAHAEELLPKQLLEEGRQAELAFANACEKLAQSYENLLMKIKETLSKL